MKSLKTLAVLALLLVAGCDTYMSEIANSKVRLSAGLSGAYESPPVDTRASGWIIAYYSPVTQMLEWRLSFTDLSGPVTWAFFQGPDGVGNERADIVPINLQIEGNPHRGGATLTAQQAKDLLAGRWSIELRTAKFPGGEIRGLLVPQGRS
jgi:hypothetical protein